MWMFLLVPAHPGCPGENPESHKTVTMCVCVCYLPNSMKILRIVWQWHNYFSKYLFIYTMFKIKVPGTLSDNLNKCTPVSIIFVENNHQTVPSLHICKLWDLTKQGYFHCSNLWTVFFLVLQAVTDVLSCVSKIIKSSLSVDAFVVNCSAISWLHNVESETYTNFKLKFLHFVETHLWTTVLFYW